MSIWQEKVGLCSFESEKGDDNLVERIVPFRCRIINVTYLKVNYSNRVILPMYIEALFGGSFTTVNSIHIHEPIHNQHEMPYGHVGNHVHMMYIMLTHANSFSDKMSLKMSD